MPIFEYKCRDCGHKFEVLVYSGDTKITCEKCGSENSDKLMSCFAGAGKDSTSAPSCGSHGGFT